MMQAIQNLGLALMSIVVGKLLDYEGYLITETFFIACLGIALIAGALLFLAYDTHPHCTCANRELSI